MATRTTPASGRKDLQDLSNLSRAPLLSYGQKQVPPKSPRPKTADSRPARFPLLAAFAPTRLWTWITEYLRYRIGRRHPFLSYAEGASDRGVYALQGDAEGIRIALAGDWATGTDEAERIGELIRAFEPHYSIHLGDIYYVGDSAETNENFLGIRNPGNGFEPCLWPAGSRGTFALNGNHEMYALGYAYFDQVLRTLGPVADGKALGQRASFFCLENEHWRIIAVDTGYNSIGVPIVEYLFQPDCALRPELLEWLRRDVRPRREDPRGIVLLGHHPPLSRFDHAYPRPARQLAEFFSGPVLWYWGHEHRLAIYPEADAGGIRAFGRCIGHGGMPVELSPATPRNPDCKVEFLDDRPYRNDEHLTVGLNGFARMTLQGRILTVDYVDVFGDVAFSESWSTGNGVLTRTRAGPPS